MSTVIGHYVVELEPRTAIHRPRTREFGTEQEALDYAGSRPGIYTVTIWHYVRDGHNYWHELSFRGFTTYQY